MRYVYDHPDEARAVGLTARVALRTHHTIQRTASFVAERLADPERLSAVGAGKRCERSGGSG
jgi:hypothetical protein